MDGLQKLTPGRLELEVLAGWLAAPPLRLALDPDARGTDRRRRGTGRPGGCRRGARLWREHRLRQAGAGSDRPGRHRRAAAPAGALAHVRRRRAAGRRHGPPGAPAQGGQPRPRPLRRSPRHDRRPPPAPGPRRPAGHPGPGVGRRLGRSGATGACRRSADRRRADQARRPGPPGRRGPGRHRPAAADAGRQGGPGAAQRHAGLDRPGDRRPAQGATAVRRRSGRWCDDHRRRPGQRRAVRSAHPAGTQPARARSRSRRSWPACSPAARSATRTSTASACRIPIRCAASPRSWGRPGTCWPRPRPCSSARPTASPTIRWCSSRRARSCPAATSTPSPWPSRRTRSPSSWRRSATCPSGAWRCSPTPARAACRRFSRPNPGLNSGFMIPQVVSAALATENKHLANAVATDTVPTCANQEDHVSLATYAARRLHLMADNLARLLAVEIIAAAQGIELRRPLALERCPGAGRSHRARGLRIPRRRPPAGRRDRGGGRHGACWSLPSMSPLGRSGPLASETRMPEILKANNRAWAARKVAADPDFFQRLERQQAPRLSVDRLLRQPGARQRDRRPRSRRAVRAPQRRQSRPAAGRQLPVGAAVRRRRAARSSTSWSSATMAAAASRRRSTASGAAWSTTGCTRSARSIRSTAASSKRSPTSSARLRPPVRAQRHPPGPQRRLRRLRPGRLGARPGAGGAWLGLFAGERARQRPRGFGRRARLRGAAHFGERSSWCA